MTNSATSKNARLYVPVYAATLLLSAFLLFVIQPLFGKMILPLLGGTPSVWNTAMLFFQSMLLAGYAYAHFATHYLTVKKQVFLHIGLLILFSIVLPIAIPEGWHPPENGNPALWQLSLMALAVGGPFFILSGSAPLLQHWFAHTSHNDAGNPYFLYAASNLGSMTSLLLYPFVFEAAWALDMQSNLWAAGYLLLILFTICAAFLVWGHAEQRTAIKTPPADEKPLTWRRRGLWLILAFVPSSLMLGVTTFITTDIASVPLLWIIPLALYLGTFIIAFARRPVPSRKTTLLLQALVMVTMLSILGSFFVVSKALLLGLHLILFGLTALMCHQELAALRPHVRHLTQFYLTMSIGGALGGVFNALIAPQLFVIPLEYSMILILACFMRNASAPDHQLKNNLKTLWARRNDGLLALIRRSGILFIFAVIGVCFYATRDINDISRNIMALIAFLYILPFTINRRWVLGICTLIILSVSPPGYVWGNLLFDRITYNDRGFFGVIRVAEQDDPGLRTLLHGTTIHGAQAMAPENRLQKLSYYSRYSGINDAFAIADHWPAGPQNIGVIGLGIGVTACFQREGRHFDFYDIDPGVIEIAQNPDYFRYLSDCGSPYDIIKGDGRLKMQDKPAQSYDVVLLDAFSSDNIPVHLLTYEAFHMYKDKLKKHGFITANISNRYLDLQPVIASHAQKLGMNALSRSHRGGILPESGLPYHPSIFIVMTEHQEHIDYLLENDWKLLEPEDDLRAWTDQYSNIMDVLKIFRTGKND